jgi:large subunit ribosomal protein L6
MSRIGKAPIYFEKTVQVTINGNQVTVKGPKTSQVVQMRPEVKAKLADGVLELVIDSPEFASLHGMYRALLQNAVTGVSKGWTRDLELNGVGYRANVSGKKLEMSLGFSHPIVYDIPEGIEIKVDKQTKITVTGADRQKVGQVASVIRSYRPPEPYLGKGVKYSDEKIRKKAGKAAGK